MKDSITPTEHEIQSQILEYLQLKKIFCWRNNSGGRISQYTNKQGKTNTYFMKFGLKGSSDILGIMPDGKFLAIEVKRDQQSKLTEDQEWFLEEVGKNNGLAIIARSLDDVIPFI